MTKNETLLTVEQAAERLSVHPITVRRHLRNGLLRGVKRGRLWRVPESALTEATPASAANAENPLARALALVEQLEVEMKDAPVRIEEKNDVVADLRAVREAQTP